MGSRDAKRKRRQERQALRDAGVVPEKASKSSLPVVESPYPAFPRPVAGHLAIAVVLGILTALLYHGALDLGFFHLDDSTFVTENPWVAGATAENIRHVLTEPYGSNYSPLHLLSYILDYELAGGFDPRVFHLSNNLWAGLGTAMVYLLGIALTSRRDIAASAALLFAVHPAHVEAVAWITSRKDLVAAAFAIPAILAWIRYRSTRGRDAKIWYGVSVVLFVAAVAGKMSVVVLPGILLCLDLFIERRRLVPALVDKIPFGLVGLFFTVRVAAAQPTTGHRPALEVIAYAMGKSLSLLLGVSDQVIYRDRPELSAAAGFGAGLLLLAIFLIPLLWTRRIPGLAYVLFYFVPIALIPSQVLSFVHPVTDRYLYFPSVGFVLLVSWGLFTIAGRWGSNGRLVASVALGLVAAGWTARTVEYLDEWRDPRSVWYGAAKKSDDVNVHLYLGSHYHDNLSQLTAKLADPESAATMREFVAADWADDERRRPLLAEWNGGVVDGALTDAWREHLRQGAIRSFEKALSVKGTRVLPNLYFRLGMLRIDAGDLDGARETFEQCYAEAMRHTSTEVRNELTVRTHEALGVVAWRQRDYEEAYRAYTFARDEQRRVGGAWLNDVDGTIARLERILGR